MSEIRIKILEEVDKDIWNKFVENSPWGDVLSLWEWGELKRYQNWRPLRVAAVRDGSIIMAAQILLKKIPFLGTYAYVAHGPVFHEIDDLDKSLFAFNEFLLQNIKNYNLVCIEIEPKIGKFIAKLGEPESEEKSTKKEPINYIDEVLNQEHSSVFDKKYRKETAKKVKTISLDAVIEDDYEETQESISPKLGIKKISSLSIGSVSKVKTKKKLNISQSFVGYKSPEDIELTKKDKTNNQTGNIEEQNNNQQFYKEQKQPRFTENISRNHLDTKIALKSLDKKPLVTSRSLPQAEPTKSLENLKITAEEENLQELEIKKHSNKGTLLKQESKDNSPRSFKDDDFIQKMKNFRTDRDKIDFTGIPQPKKHLYKTEFTEIVSTSEEKSYEELKDTPLKYLVDPRVIEVFTKHGYQITGRNRQPKYKLYYDLTLSEDELLDLCKKNTRYNIRLAKKKGVKIEEFVTTDSNIENKIKEFYSLLEEARERTGGYPITAYEHLQRVFKFFYKKNNIVLLESSYEGQTIAMNVTEITKFWASSFYASSNRKFPKVKAPYLLRWASIMLAKNMGAKIYDFWGVVPQGSIINSQNHQGYSDHKLSFGGFRIDNYGLLAFPISPIKFSLWDTAIWLRKHLLELFYKLRGF